MCNIILGSFKSLCCSKCISGQKYFFIYSSLGGHAPCRGWICPWLLMCDPYAEFPKHCTQPWQYVTWRNPKWPKMHWPVFWVAQVEKSPWPQCCACCSVSLSNTRSNLKHCTKSSRPLVAKHWLSQVPPLSLQSGPAMTSGQMAWWRYQCGNWDLWG